MQRLTRLRRPRWHCEKSALRARTGKQRPGPSDSGQACRERTRSERKACGKLPAPFRDRRRREGRFAPPPAPQEPSSSFATFEPPGGSHGRRGLQLQASFLDKRACLKALDSRRAFLRAFCGGLWQGGGAAPSRPIPLPHRTVSGFYLASRAGGGRG